MIRLLLTFGMTFGSVFLAYAATTLTWAQQGNPEQPLPEGTVVHSNLKYGPHQRNKLDLYLPPNLEKEAKVPLVIWVHGGGWVMGDKGGANPASFLLPQGYAVASVNYRYSNQSLYPAQIADVRAAVRFLREKAQEYQLDAERFGAWGGSAGGHLVALLATGEGVAELDGDYEKSGVSPGVQAVVDWFGPADLTRVYEIEAADKLIAQLLGGPPTEKSKLAKLASPSLLANEKSAPILIIHGDKDNLVPIQESQKLLKAYQDAKAKAELLTLEGAGHGGQAFLADGTLEKVLSFFNTHLKPE